MMYSANIICDSISPDNIRLTTLEITYPRIIHAEFMTHRMFSRNSASSRAIPINKVIERVLKDPFVPEYWGKNQKGMKARNELTPSEQEEAKAAWLQARDQAVASARILSKIGLDEKGEGGVHKQLTNRILEPFMYHTVLVTATEWSNWDGLRRHEDAQPEIRKIADMMFQARENSIPFALDYGQWHMPLVDDYLILKDNGFTDAQIREISVGRCCRISYLTHHGVRDPQADIDLCRQLRADGHMCYDDQTEVLTKSGWKNWNIVSDEDYLLAVDIKNNTCNFEKPIALHQYYIDEELYHVYGQQLDLKVTLNHNMVVAHRKADQTWSEFDLTPASEIKGKPRRYLKSANFTGGEDITEYLYDNSSGFMKLLGFFIGDGYAIAGNRIEFHLKKQRKINFLYSLGYVVRKLKNNKYIIEMPEIGTWFRTNCYTENKEKKFPNWILKINNKAALDIFNGLCNSDGSLKRNTWVYYSTSKDVADTLQALLHINGKVGSFSFVTYKDNKQYIKINVSDRISPRVEISQKGRSYSYKEQLTNYKGRVFCATVSTGAIMVRRNGHVSISGNSPFEHVARPMTDYDLMMHSTETDKLNDTMPFAGNLRGWISYRKKIPNESDYSKIVI